MLICAACADCPGKTTGVYAGGYCRNFRAKAGIPCEPPGAEVRAGEPVCRIPLTQGKFALVDSEDYEELSKHKWCAIRGKHTWYAYRRGPDGKGISMHRVIMKTPEGMVVDHIYGDGLDNRKRHMRNCTYVQNARNSRPRCVQTGFKGGGTTSRPASMRPGSGAGTRAPSSATSTILSRRRWPATARPARTRASTPI